MTIEQQVNLLLCNIYTMVWLYRNVQLTLY